MLFTVEELKSMKEFKDIDETTLKRKIEAIETAIRSYTNNKFQNLRVRFKTKSFENKLLANNPYLKTNDTLEISQSINNGLYVITESTSSSITLNKSIFDADFNLVTKVEYPQDILEGSLKMLNWDISNADKLGVASETISRHSVTYFNMDKENSVGGYPVSLMGFCKPYMRART